MRRWFPASILDGNKYQAFVAQHKQAAAFYGGVEPAHRHSSRRVFISAEESSGYRVLPKKCASLERIWYPSGIPHAWRDQGCFAEHGTCDRRYCRGYILRKGRCLGSGGRDG